MPFGYGLGAGFVGLVTRCGGDPTSWNATLYVGVSMSDASLWLVFGELFVFLETFAIFDTYLVFGMMRCHDNTNFPAK